MKSLDEKKLLARMARNMGQPDLSLEESIRTEEALIENLFRLKEIQPIQPSTPILKEELPKPAETNIVPKEQELIKQTVSAISDPKFSKPTIPNLQQQEISGIRKQIAELTQKMGTLSWGGGGTGVVRFVDLDDHKVPTDINRIELNSTGSDYNPPASLSWNPIEDCLNIYQEDGSTLQVGLENYIRVYNNSGSTLENGSLVVFGGVEGDVPVVIKATANATFNSLYTVGVLTNDILDGEYGRATTFGNVRDINTTGSGVSETWAAGDLLWMHPTQAGKLTKVKPTPPNSTVSVAAVLKVGTTDGEILVRPVIEYRKSYGSFSDTELQTHTASAINTPQILHINATDFSSGHVLGANSNVVSQFSGLYNYQFSVQVTSTSANKSDIYIWPRKNKQDIPNSASIHSINMNNGNAVLAWNFIVLMDAGDEFQLMWAVSDTSLKILGATSTAFCPSIPSVLLTVTQVA